MGVRHLVAVLSLISWSPVSGWFFNAQSGIARANGKPVDESCVAHGQAGHCEFYECFEQRLPCGADGYMLRFGLPYCGRFQRTLPAFTEQGQAFINGTSRCLTRGLLAFYSRDSVDCHRLSHAAFDAISSCYAANGFCDVLEDNSALFVDVYQPKHLFQHGALKIWREILEVTYHCDPERVHNFANTVLNFLSGIVSLITTLSDP